MGVQGGHKWGECGRFHKAVNSRQHRVSRKLQTVVYDILPSLTISVLSARHLDSHFVLEFCKVLCAKTI